MSIRTLLLTLVVALAAAVLPVRGQSIESSGLERRPRATQYLYRSWNAEDGLPQNTVYAIEQTSDGYLWLGTQEGLVRFDGIRFTVFDTYQVAKLPSHSISTLMEDRNGALWIGMHNGGLARFEGGAFHVYMSGDGLPQGDVSALMEAEDGTIWIGTDGGGLASFDGRRFNVITASDGLASNRVLAIEQSPDGAVWIGANPGLSRLKDGRIETYTQADGLPGKEVLTLLSNEAGALWIGTDQGLTRYRGGEFQRLPQLDGNCEGIITDLIQDEAGSLWIGTLETGVCRLTGDDVQVLSRAHGLSHNHVRALHEDWEGSLWIGTNTGGLNQVRASKFAVYGTKEGLADETVYTIHESDDGVVWIGTSAGGINRLQNGRVTHLTTQDGLSSDFVLSLMMDSEGTLWAGTYDGGVCRRRNGRFACLDADRGLASDFVSSLYEDSRGVVWIGTDAGLHRYEDGRFELYTVDDGLPDQVVISMSEDQSGDLWIGTGKGITRMRADKVVGVPSADSLSKPILSIYHDAEGAVWLGTHGGGLVRLRGNEATTYTSANGLFDDTVIQILEDDTGNLWLGSNRGIARIAKRQFSALDGGRIDRLAPEVYDENDGLRSRELNGGTQPAAMKGRDGRLWFSTLRGAAVIDPSSITRNQVPPPVVIEELLVNESPATVAPGISLDPSSKKFEFRYTGLSFAAPERVTFQIMLDGVDDSWVDVGTRRQAFYTNLSPGSHTFHVRAANDDGVWSPTEASLSFYLEPRFYQTRWFYVLACLSVVGLVVGGYRLRTRNLKARERELARVVEAQTSELKSQKSELERLNHNLEQEVQRQLDIILQERNRYERQLIKAKEKAEDSARLKAAILTNMTHEFRTPLTAILGYGQILSDEVVGEQKEFVDYITQNGDRLLATLDSILELSAFQNGDVELSNSVVDLAAICADVVAEAAPVAERKTLELQFASCEGPVSVTADEKAVATIARKLVDNAVKFTAEGSITVDVGERNGQAILRVRDTGIGIDDAFIPHVFEAFKQESQGLSRSHEGSGLGLALAREMASAMGGQIHVASRKGEGSTFTVTFPIYRGNGVELHA